MTSKESVAAQNRFIYYPDHLVRMPGPGDSILAQALSVFTEPVYKGTVLGSCLEFFRDQRPDSLRDESIGSFLSRRVGASVPENIVSAIIHGIYAGDIYQLSARSLLPVLWYYEGWQSSIIQGAMMAHLEDDSITPSRDFSLMKEFRKSFRQENGQPVQGMEVITNITKSSVYTFKRGIGQLATQLVNALKMRPFVKIRKNHVIDKLKTMRSNGIQKVHVQLYMSNLCSRVETDTSHRQRPNNLYP